MSLRCLFGHSWGETVTYPVSVKTFQTLEEGIELVTVEIDKQRCEHCNKTRKTAIRPRN